jgi:hypothetical protein
MINPAVNADTYVDESEYLLAEDSETADPKHGTTVQSGWGALEAKLQPKKTGDYPVDFRFSSETQLIRFLDDAPFAVYDQHWIEREGKKSFVCQGSDCPLCIIVGDKPRQRAAWTVLALSEETPSVQILTASAGLARTLMAANNDPRKGPLSKYFWAISRQGTGPQTQYSVDRVKATDLIEEWELEPDHVNALVANSKKFDATAISITPREELLTIAQQFKQLA